MRQIQTEIAKAATVVLLVAGLLVSLVIVVIYL